MYVLYSLQLSIHAYCIKCFIKLFCSILTGTLCFLIHLCQKSVKIVTKISASFELPHFTSMKQYAPENDLTFSRQNIVSIYKLLYFLPLTGASGLQQAHSSNSSQHIHLFEPSLRPSDSHLSCRLFDSKTDNIQLPTHTSTAK